MAEDKYNLKNPAVKRILQEVKEMQSNPSDDYMSLPLEENIFEWQFAISGPRDTEFEGGIYHGRIQLPAEYPFKPPSFMLLTPNGRFETQTKICLSISNHHPEHWQPSWSVRTALVALIAFMPTKPDGALGSLDYPKEERHVLAIKSRKAAPKYGSPERQKLIDEIHEYLLSKAPPVPKLNPTVHTPEENSNRGEGETSNNPETGNALAVINNDEQPNMEPEPGMVEDVREVRVNADAGIIRVSLTARWVRHVPEVRAGDAPETRSLARVFRIDDVLTWAAVMLIVAILILLVNKYLKSVTGQSSSHMGEL